MIGDNDWEATCIYDSSTSRPVLSFLPDGKIEFASNVLKEFYDTQGINVPKGVLSDRNIYRVYPDEEMFQDAFMSYEYPKWDLQRYLKQDLQADKLKQEKSNTLTKEDVPRVPKRDVVNEKPLTQEGNDHQK